MLCGFFSDKGSDPKSFDLIEQVFDNAFPYGRAADREKSSSAGEA